MCVIGSNKTIKEAVQTNSVPSAANLNRPENKIVTLYRTVCSQ